jgi:hypothetical protein
VHTIVVKQTSNIAFSLSRTFRLLSRTSKLNVSAVGQSHTRLICNVIHVSVYDIQSVPTTMTSLHGESITIRIAQHVIL